MNIENEIFKKSKFDYDKLFKYGFIDNKKEFLYIKNILNDSFKLEVSIINDKVSLRVIDLELDEEYLSYKILEQNGDFVNKVREEIKNVLIDIRNNCCINKTFIFEQTSRIVSFIYERFNDKPMFMFDKYPGVCVFKNLNNNKWYGIIMNVDRSKLDSSKSGEVEIINLKIDSDKIKELLLQKGYYEAYHMNKKYWISIILDDSISDKNIEQLIIESYNNIIK